MPVIALGLLVVMAALIFLGPRAGLQPLTTFRLFALALLACTLVSLAGAGGLIWAWLQQNTELLSYSLASVLIALLPLVAAVLVVGPSSLTAPVIHDISTDLENPPRFDTAPSLRRDSDNSLEYGGEPLARRQREAYPDIAPIITTLPPEAALERAGRVAEGLDWQITAMDSNSLEATETSRLFGFIDDIVIRVSPRENGSRLDLRSVSRVGSGDLGANAERIRRFRAAWEARD